MERKLEDSTFVHSPGSHYHQPSATANLDLESSSSGQEDSDVSDMVVENPSRFQGLSKDRRKSGGSDYRPQSESNSESGSASPSHTSSESYSTRSTPFSSKRQSPASRLSEEDNDSEGALSRSVSIPPPPRSQGRFKNSPLVRKSPLSVAHRSSSSEVTAMRGYRYSMLPSRSAAMNVNYTGYLDEESDSDDNFAMVKKKRPRKQIKDSESEFEMSGAAETSDEAASLSEQFSEDEYRPPRRKAKGGRRKVQ